MFSLFPKSWFKSRGRDAIRMAEVAAILKTEWRKSLAKALAQVTKTEIAPKEAAQSLELLEFSRLLSVDQALRRGQWLPVHESSWTKGPLLIPVREKSVEVSAYLFVAACHGNGFIREGALIAFEHYPDRLAVAAALIRCDDWVPAVQQAAVNLLINLLKSTAAPSVFDQLQLLLRLKRRQRITEHIWPEKIEPALRASEFRDSRWKSTRSNDPDTRAFAYRLVLESDPDRAVEAIDNACADGHPKVALWGLSTAGVVLSPPSSESLLKRALGHKSAAVRTHVLRTYEELGAPDLQEALERALFDASRGPRDAAAFLLDQRFGESAPQHWRAAIDSGDEGKAPIAVNALAYAAEGGDIERLTPYLRHPIARTRASALRGLIRAKAQRSEDFLSNALRDMSGLVVRVALRLLSKEGPLLDLNTLAQAYASASSEAVRRQLIHGSRVLGKWDTLAFLLPLVLTEDAAFASAEIERWFRSSNRRFTPLDLSMGMKLEADVRKLQEGAPSPRWIELLAILAHA
jgi:hypothetical protein